jgi:hypothetical protein
MEIMLKWILEILCDDVNRLHVAQGRGWLVGGGGAVVNTVVFVFYKTGQFVTEKL